MDRDEGICGMADAGRVIAWPDGWFARHAHERRPARTGRSCPLVEAIVHRGPIPVRSVRGWRESFGESEPARDSDSMGELPPDPAPCEACERDEDAVRIRAALATLPGHYRQVLHLVYVDGHTHGEAATHLAVPIGTAKAWVRRGLRALRAAHISLNATPTLKVATASHLLVGLRLASRRTPSVALEVTATPG